MKRPAGGVRPRVRKFPYGPHQAAFAESGGHVVHCEQAETSIGMLRRQFPETNPYLVLLTEWLRRQVGSPREINGSAPDRPHDRSVLFTLEGQFQFVPGSWPRAVYQRRPKAHNANPAL